VGGFDVAVDEGAGDGVEVCGFVADDEGGWGVVFWWFLEFGFWELVGVDVWLARGRLRLRSGTLWRFVEVVCGMILILPCLRF
jgi:hypothetical protein